MCVCEREKRCAGGGGGGGGGGGNDREKKRGGGEEGERDKQINTDRRRNTQADGQTSRQRR